MIITIWNYMIYIPFYLFIFCLPPFTWKLQEKRNPALSGYPSYLWSLPGTKQPSINTCEELREERGPRWPLQSCLGSYIIISVLPTKAGQAWLCTSSVSPTHGGLSVFAVIRKDLILRKSPFCNRDPEKVVKKRGGCLFPPLDERRPRAFL